MAKKKKKKPTSTRWLVWMQIMPSTLIGKLPPKVFVRKAAKTWADEKKNLPNGRGHMHIRSITPRAAARQFIRDNMHVEFYKADDGANEPPELTSPSPHNKYKPHKELAYAKKLAKSYGEPIIEIIKD